MDNLSYFASLMPINVNLALSRLNDEALMSINEIRLRREKPVIILIKSSSLFITDKGLQDYLNSNCIIISSKDFDDVTDRLCNNSYHTNMSNMINGFITTKSGARVGIAATAVYRDKELKSVKEISSLCIRIPHTFSLCSAEILKRLYLKSLPSIIVAGRPASGKTTLLRDLSYQLSSGFNGNYRRVTVVDERNELSYENNGVNLDTLIGFNKAKGIEMAIRTLAPELIVCDEIGSPAELEAISHGFSSGVSFAVSVHLKSEEQINNNLIMRHMIMTGEFDYIVLLKSYTDDYEIIKIGDSKNAQAYRRNNDCFIYNLPWNISE